MKERYYYIIQAGDEESSIKELLRNKMSISSRLLRRLKVENRVYLDGKNIRLYEKGEAGSKITLRLPEESSDFLPEDIPLDVIYEDEDLLALNKQAGIVVHPTKGHPTNTLTNGIMKYMLDREESYKIRFINRLDLDTTGVVLVGKNSYCQDDFTRQAACGTVEKKYLAVVKGIVEMDKGVIDQPIGKPAEDDIKRAVMAGGYPSITHYEVVERFERGYTLLRLQLMTGRTHQIRVHLSHLGHPIAGDSLYGGPDELIDRQALHAEQLNFDHPIINKKILLAAPLPEDMSRLISAIGQA